MSLVMIVDDMAVVREPIAASLRASGYQTACAASGAEALAGIQTAAPDLVLLDLSMPGMDGIAVLRALRRSGKTASLPVILLTASSDKSHVIEAARLGVRDYVLKSRFSLPELLSRVSKYICPHALTADNSNSPALAVTPSSDPQAPLLAVERIRQSEELARTVTATASLAGDLTELSGLIARDPILSARVLRAANCAAYRTSRGAISSISEAVRNMGCTTVYNLIGAGSSDAG